MLDSSTRFNQVATVVTRGGGRSPQLHDLPAVLIVNVFSYLDTRCLVRAESAHRLLHAETASSAFWEGLYALRWRRADEKQGVERVRVFTAKYGLTRAAIEQRCQQADSAPASPGLSSVDWHALYCKRHVVERKWATGRALITTLNGHNGTVTCLQFDGSRLVRCRLSLFGKQLC